MSDIDNKNPYEEYSINSEIDLEKQIKKIVKEEQVYSIALFDILGFSNFVENNGNQVILDLYNKLVDIIKKQQTAPNGNTSFAGSVAPSRISEDWKSAILVANANGFINVGHFSDTFILYVNYNLRRPSYWLATPKNDPHPLLIGEIGAPQYPIFYDRHPIYLSFLQTCMEFFCQSIVAGIPLRGCIATGLAIMNSYDSIFLGSPIVEAAKGETAQNSLGIAFGKSFNNSHPVYNSYFIPYLDHIKENRNSSFLSPMVLDWARYWRESPDYKEHNFNDCIAQMNKDSQFSKYYDNAVKFFEFSAIHKNWSHEINRNGVKDITDYYKRTKEWYESRK